MSSLDRPGTPPILASSESRSQSGNLVPSRKVGPYRILGRLGVGGMGAVYRAYDDRLRRTVAIKHILPDIAGDDGSRRRLKREAQAAAGLSHPSIVQIFDIFEADGVDWIVMELVEGETLSSLVESGRLGLAEAVSLSREIAEGLAEAHGKGIVHRDLKTENVMVTHSFHAKILDFGLAKSMVQTQESGITDLGAIFGTGRAMSPEQAMGAAVDPRSDLFSLGTLVFEAITGRSPFAGKSIYNTLARVCSAPHTPARQVNRHVPVELSNLVDRLLEKRPEHRPRSAAEVVVELRVIEKMALPQWGGPYAPWVSGAATEADGPPVEFHDLDPAALPPASNPPLATSYGELAGLHRRQAEGEPTLEVPSFDPAAVGSEALDDPTPRAEAGARGQGSKSQQLESRPLELRRIDSSTLTEELPRLDPTSFEAVSPEAPTSAEEPSATPPPEPATVTAPTPDPAPTSPRSEDSASLLPVGFASAVDPGRVAPRPGIRIATVLALLAASEDDDDRDFLDRGLLADTWLPTIEALDGWLVRAPELPSPSPGGLLVLFERPYHAVLAALRLLQLAGMPSAEMALCAPDARPPVGHLPGLRAAVHLGEVTVEGSAPPAAAIEPGPESDEHGAGDPGVGEHGRAWPQAPGVSLAARGKSLRAALELASLAADGEVLATVEAHHLSHRAAREEPPSLRRPSGVEHGTAYLETLAETIEVFRIGLERSPPADRATWGEPETVARVETGPDSRPGPRPELDGSAANPAASPVAQALDDADLEDVAGGQPDPEATASVENPE